MALTTTQHEFDIFDPRWQAKVSGSQSLTKSLKNCDIESINVVKVCEKLTSAINESSNSKQKSCQRIEYKTDQYDLGKSSMRFRAFSNIWFGTLKIYQQQVNTLFRLSEDLFSRSCTNHIKSFGTNKRKSSLTHNTKIVKKRRLTLCETNEETNFSPNYAELLDDLEKLAQEPTEIPLTEFSKSISGPITELRLREITICEITSTVNNATDVIDDSGFGEATHEEIAEFFNIIDDNSMFHVKRMQSKRKSTFGEGSPIKRTYTNEHAFEPVNGENVSMCENILKRSSLNRSITPAEIHANNTVENINILEYKNDKIKIESSLNMANTEEVFNDVKKKRKLIIDECIKIDMSEIINEMRTTELSIKLTRRKILKSYKSNRNKTAAQLLIRFNRGSSKLSLSFKQIISLSREQFERDFLNLLREIFKNDYQEKSASLIYPKWISFEDVLIKEKKKQQRNNKARKQKKFNLQTESAIRNLSVADNNNGNDDQEIPAAFNNNMKSLNIHNSWRPYGVMLKLLNLWRVNQTNKIAAIKLFKLAENQIERALGFSSLLNLSKKHFLKLTSFPQSIELQNILIGKAIKCNTTENFT